MFFIGTHYDVLAKEDQDCAQSHVAGVYEQLKAEFAKSGVSLVTHKLLDAQNVAVVQQQLWPLLDEAQLKMQVQSTMPQASLLHDVMSEYRSTAACRRVVKADDLSTVLEPVMTESVRALNLSWDTVGDLLEALGECVRFGNGWCWTRCGCHN